MELNRRTILTGLAATAASTTLLVPARARAAVPQGYPANYAEIIEASKAEKNVFVYHSLSTEHMQGYVQLMGERYPWLKVELLDAGAEAFSRYLAESASNTRTGDLLIVAAANGWIEMIDRGEIYDYVSPEGGAFPDWANPHPGLYTATVDPSIIVYNKMLLPEDARPTSFAQLAEMVQARPDLFGKRLTAYGPTFNAYGYSLNYFLIKRHGEKFWDWLNVLAPNTRYERAIGVMTEKVTSGEYVLAYLSGSSVTRDIMTDPARSALLGWSFITDGTPMIMRGAAIPKKVRNPNAAKLALDLLLSRDCQISLGKNFRTPARSDVMPEDTNGGLTYSFVRDSIGEENMVLINYDRGLLDQYDAFVKRFEAIPR